MIPPIRLTDLFDSWETSDRYHEVKKQVDKLRLAYGDGGNPDSLRGALNKRLAHLTRHRAQALGYDYTPLIAPLESLIEDIFRQIENLGTARA